MSFWTIQTVLASRGTDSENAPWIQLLVFVIIAVIAGIQGIAKNRAKKNELDDDEKIEETFSRPKPKTPFQLASKKAKAQYKQEIKYAIIKPIYESNIVPIESDVNKIAKISFDDVLPQPKLNSLALKGKMSTEASMLEPHIKHQQAIIDYYDALQFDDMEKVRTAILYSEILSKPLSLRETVEHL